MNNAVDVAHGDAILVQETKLNDETKRKDTKRNETKRRESELKYKRRIEVVKRGITNAGELRETNDPFSFASSLLCSNSSSPPLPYS